jgi:hypothetical protein
MLCVAIKSNDLLGLVLYQIHQAKIGGKRIRWCDGETWKDISIPFLYIRKPGLAAQRRAIASYPFFNQTPTNLPARCQSEGVYSFGITWPIR